MSMYLNAFTSWAAAHPGMYSASIVDRATTGCFRDV